MQLKQNITGVAEINIQFTEPEAVSDRALRRICHALHALKASCNSITQNRRPQSHIVDLRRAKFIHSNRNC
jgi:hypothetical protein